MRGKGRVKTLPYRGAVILRLATFAQDDNIVLCAAKHKNFALCTLHFAFTERLIMDQHEFYTPERDSFETGSTNPPKTRGGIIAVLLCVGVDVLLFVWRTLTDRQCGVPCDSLGRV